MLVPEDSLLDLDGPRPWSRAAILRWVGVVVVYGAFVLWIVTRADTTLTPLIWVPVTHAIVGALVCGGTAVLLLWLAATTGRRGYQWLGGTYLYVAGVLLLFPLLFPGGFGGDEPLLGGTQSAITDFYLWTYSMQLGILAAVVVLWWDRRQHRRSGLGHPVWMTAVVVVAALVVTGLLLGPGDSLLPALLGPDGTTTTLALSAKVFRVVLALVTCALALYTARQGALTQRWLLAVSVLLLGEALVNLGSQARWSVSWYSDRLFNVIALTALFAVLLAMLAKVSLSTSKLATRDSLTGCLSRIAFTDLLDQEVARGAVDGSQRALLWVDLDDFKSVNDQVGHGIGDEILRTVYQRIQAAVGPSDVIGRLAGDEFGILLIDDVSVERAEAVAERIVVSLRDAIVVDETISLLSACVGVAVSPEDARTAADLLSHADLAMNAGKRNGGDRAGRFSTDLSALASSRATLRHQLAAAIRDEQFEFDVQPIHSVGAGQRLLLGLEVLVRWQNGSERLSAGAFIEFGNATGQIVAIGLQMLTRLQTRVDDLLACLPDDGFVTVNVSVKELSDPRIVEQLLHGRLVANASRIALEVTESADLTRGSEAYDNLAILRGAGYSVAVDDFGTGFSNFARLEQLQASLLKIDRSLVVRSAQEWPMQPPAFIEASTTIAGSLDCVVIAEGVETEEQLMMVIEAGITLVQGYLLGRPVPVEDWLREQAATTPDHSGTVV